MIVSIVYMIGCDMFAYAFARHEADHDGVVIGRDGVIKHRQRFVMRAVVTACVMTLGAGITEAFDVHYRWSLALALASVAFAFSTMFRYRLNAIRSKDVCYISPSNWYDQAFLLIGTGSWISKEDHKAHYGINDLYTENVHISGRVAYAFETVISPLCGCLFIYLNHIA